MSTWSLMTFQDSASPSMEQLIFFHDFTMVSISLITVLVTLSILFICVCSYSNRFMLQDQMIEIIWTLFPVLILFMIALPSLKVLYLLDDPFSPDISMKVMGHQWYWSYEYSDFFDLNFDSYMLPLEDNLYMNRLLDVDNSLVLPIQSRIRMVCSSSDVIHAWTIPSLGIKMDAVPGRLNQVMFIINRSGIFYGQCSEICGSNHSFMPIKLEAVPLRVFMNWASKLMS